MNKLIWWLEIHNDIPGWILSLAFNSRVTLIKLDTEAGLYFSNDCSKLNSVWTVFLEGMNIVAQSFDARKDWELGFSLATLKNCYKRKYENKCSLFFLPGPPLNSLLACDYSEALWLWSKVSWSQLTPPAEVRTVGAEKSLSSPHRAGKRRDKHVHLATGKQFGQTTQWRLEDFPLALLRQV